MKTVFKHLAAFTFALAAIAVAAGEPVLVANKNLSSEKLDPDAIKAVFLGKKVAWGTGGRVVLAVLKDGAVADAFLPKATDLSSSSFRNYWRRLAMTGGGTPPKRFDDDDALVKFVAETPGAIGFVDRAHADKSVLTIAVP